MKNNNILIIGRGFIGSRLQGELGCAISGEKIYNFQDAEAQLERYNPGIVINCVGYTGEKNIDGCEFEKDKTLTANSFIPILLSEACLRQGVKLVHISSGCIYHYDYSSDQPIKEEKEQDFFELYYSRTKIYAEKVLAHLCEKYDILIPRIRIPLDDRPHPRNILTKLIEYKKVIDLPNSVTYLPDFFAALKHLIKIDARGIYNLVNDGPLRFPQLMEVYKKYNPGFSYEVIDFKQLNLSRTNLILSTEKLKNSGFKVRPIEEVLEECVQSYLKY
ncbi:MAG: sugar nucleotide-binding protein [Candidatus Omnitrophota bacterium]|nr:sugar nucleotide-binding protein [Candidatus Omnitrophota bacterium]